MAHESVSPLIEGLHKTLIDLAHNPYPYVENPPSCKKRASVALILRIRPHFDHPPEDNISPSDPSLSAEQQLEHFFEQAWVQHGEPEALFIKRAARKGDRWSAHVALPGGKRDIEDEDDRATAVREVREEVGLHLGNGDVVSVGNLPERVVSTAWGKVPIMVLCPFLFIYTKADIPPVRLQPTEIASTHWVPLRVLLSPKVRTYEYVDVSDRFARREGFAVKALVRSLLGKMRFSAIRLVPSESVYCTTIAEFFPLIPPEAENTSIVERLYGWYLGDHAGVADNTRPLLLWGLTLGILADFLDQLPPHNAIKLWSYPTFTTWDSRFFVHLLTMRLKQRNQAALEAGNQTAVDMETEAVATMRPGEGSGDNPWFVGGLSDGMKCEGKNAGKSYAVGVMLEGYYDAAKRGVWLTLLGRVAGTAALGWLLINRYKQRA